MAPDDPRHGTNAGYLAHRRDDEIACADCRAARVYYEKRRIHDAHRNQPRLVDPTGTQRRIQALVTLGWTYAAIGERMGITGGAVYRIINRYTVIRRAVADRVAEVYESMSMTLPPMNTRQEKRDASYARTVARKRGWAPPLAWDCIDTDPHPKGLATADSRAWDDYDETVVERILAGEWRTRARLPERLAVVAVWAADGLSTNEIERRTGWNVRRDQRRSEGTAA